MSLLQLAMVFFNQRKLIYFGAAQAQVHLHDSGAVPMLFPNSVFQNTIVVILLFLTSDKLTSL